MSSCRGESGFGIGKCRSKATLLLNNGLTRQKRCFWVHALLFILSYMDIHKIQWKSKGILWQLELLIDGSFLPTSPSNPWFIWGLKESTIYSWTTWARFLTLPIVLIPFPQLPILTFFISRNDLVLLWMSMRNQISLASLVPEVAGRIFILLCTPCRKSMVIVPSMGHIIQSRKLQWAADSQLKIICSLDLSLSTFLPYFSLTFKLFVSINQGIRMTQLFAFLSHIPKWVMLCSLENNTGEQILIQCREK